MTDQTADQAAKHQSEAVKKHAEDTKKKLADERAAREKASKDTKAAGDVKPTPTQEENDLAASGVHVLEHEDDGSGPDPNSPEAKQQADTHKQSEAKPAAKGGYATRASTPA
jgi:hypothetical protein